MSDANAVCLVSCPRLRRTLERTMLAGGYVVHPSQPGASIRDGTRIVFIDRETRSEMTDAQFAALTPNGTSLVMLGDSLEDNEIAQLLRTPGIDHLISDSADLDEGELLTTSVKLASGDIFGVEKYLPWGAKIHELEVRTYDEKRRALDAIVAYAKSTGARRPLMARLEHVTDELLMNALYDAPAVREGISTLARINALGADFNKVVPEESAVLRYGCDGRYFAVSAVDTFGELRKDVIFDHLVRARLQKGQPLAEGEGRGGAGLGLYFILSSATRFIVNIHPGHRTEVMCLFDMKQSGREMDSCARSVHIFTGNRPAEPQIAAA